MIFKSTATRVSVLASSLLLAAGSAWAAGPISGVVNANGTVQGSPTSFTVSHPSTGKYVITFATAFSPNPNCVFQPVGSQVFVDGLGENSNSCTVVFETISKKQPKGSDTLFVFDAIQEGP